MPINRIRADIAKAKLDGKQSIEIPMEYFDDVSKEELRNIMEQESLTSIDLVMRKIKHPAAREQHYLRLVW